MGYEPPRQLTREEMEFFFNNVSDLVRMYYYNKFRHSTNHRGLLTVFDTSGVYWSLKTNYSPEALRTLVEMNRNDGRHVDFKDEWILLHDESKGLMETSDDQRKLMKPYLDEFFEWANGLDHIREEWLEGIEAMKAHQ